MSDDRRISFSHEDPLLTRKGIGLYQRHPERSSWTQTETWERSDGSRYIKSRRASRWAGEYSFGDWTIEEKTSCEHMCGFKDGLAATCSRCSLIYAEKHATK